MVLTDATAAAHHIPSSVIRPLLPFALLAAAVASAACDSQSPSGTRPMRTELDSAEQVMYNARMIIVSNGVRRGEAHGSAIYSFDGATRFLIRPLRIQFVTPLGRPLAMVAASDGRYSLADSVLRARGPVTVTADSVGRTISTGGAITYDPKTNVITGDSAFTATAGTRKLSGVGFTADPGLLTIKCLARCTGSLGR